MTTYLGGEAPVADRALERALFRVAAIVDFQSGIAGECFETQITGGIPTS